MPSIEDIPHLPDQATRLAEITVDAYGRDEELSGFEVYVTDALRGDLTRPGPVGACRAGDGAGGR